MEGKHFNDKHLGKIYVILSVMNALSTPMERSVIASLR